jgi:hypothetical protein
MSDIILPDVVLRGVPRIVEYLRVRLNEPDLTESKVRGWIAYKKIRTYQFGSQYTAKTTELDEDVAGKAAYKNARPERQTSGRVTRNRPSREM